MSSPSKSPRISGPGTKRKIGGSGCSRTSSSSSLRPSHASSNDRDPQLELGDKNATVDKEHMEQPNAYGEEEWESDEKEEGVPRKRTKRRAKAWDHFKLIKDKDGKPRAQCLHCEKSYAADTKYNGTSSMNNHMSKCKNHPDNKCETIAKFCQNISVGTKEGGSNWKFDQESIRKAIARMIIVDELPFRFVENEGFRHLMCISCPQLIVPSRMTIARDCLNMFVDEKNRLKSLIKSTGLRMSLTTDLWTSNQNLSYLCLTGHYIDDEWKLHKLILNFVPCPKHKGDEVGHLIEKCLLDWGIDKVFGVTVDNASANDVTVAYLKRSLINWGTSILNGKYLHMRCVAHIVNLIVKEGLKHTNSSIDRVRAVVRYVRSSPMRLKRFKELIVEEKIESKKSLCLDIATRWNSTYLMLDTALIFKNVFDRYEIYDSDFRKDFMPGGTYEKIGLPTKYDWTIVEKFVKVLRHFYDLTPRVSGSLFVTSNIFFDDLNQRDLP